MGLVCILAGILAFGLGLIAVGLVGRRIAPTTRCRRCQFDLSGHPDLFRHADRTQPCPECGQDLARPLATYIKKRERRRTPLMLGLTTLLVSLLSLALLLPFYTRPGVMAVKPMWLLRFDAEWERTRDAALQEFIRRQNTQQVSNDELRDFARDGIAISSLVRPEPWNQIIDDALRLHGLLDASDVERYAVDMFRNEVTIPASAWRGDQAYLKRSYGYARPANSWQVRSLDMRLRWNGEQPQTLDKLDHTHGYLVNIPESSAGSERQVLTGHCEIDMQMQWPASDTVYEWTAKLPITINTVPKGTKLVDVITAGDGSAPYQIECKSIRVINEETYFRLDSVIVVRELAVPLVANVEFFGRAPLTATDESTRPLNRLNFRAWDKNATYPYTFTSLSRMIQRTDYPDITTDQVIAYRLVPDPDTARRLGIWRIIGEIELQGVEHTDY